MSRFIEEMTPESEARQIQDDQQFQREADAFDKVNMVRDAQEKLLEAIELIRQATKGHQSESNTDAYIIAPLRIIASNDHGYLSRDKSLDDVIHELAEQVGGCTCGELDYRWDEATSSMRCWECGGLEVEAA